MASVNVPTMWIAQSSLPGICARHGGPATQGQRRKFYTRTSPWVLLLVPFTLLLALIVALATRETVEGQLPACERCTRDRRRHIQTVWAGWLASLLVLVIGAANASSGTGGAFLLLWLALTAFMLYWSFAEQRYRVTGRLSKDRQWVELLGADRAFVTALSSALQAPPVAMQPAMAPSPSSGAMPAHWAADPTGRHQLRWWDGTSWTANVHDNGITSTD
jgi:hypothetical protein